MLARCLRPNAPRVALETSQTVYLNVVQLAESFGVEESVIEGWVRRDALPCVLDRRRMLFDRSQVVNWAAARGLAARAGFLAPTPANAGSRLRLDQLLRAGGIWRDVAAGEVLGVLERVVTAMPGATPPVCQLLVQRLHTPGGVTWAPIGGGFALPHLRAAAALGRDSGTLALLLLREPLPLTETPPDAEPVRRLLFFVAPSPRAHLELLAQLSMALSRGKLREPIRAGASDADIFAHLAAVEASSSRPTSPPESP